MFSYLRGWWRAFKRFWHDQVTTPNGDIDGARVGLLTILVGAASMIYLEYYAVIHVHQVYDPAAFGDGLIKAGSAIGIACAGIAVKSGSETPYNPAIAAANFPGDPGVAAAAGMVQSQINELTNIGNNDVNQVRGFWNNVMGFWNHMKAYFHKSPHQPPK